MFDLFTNCSIGSGLWTTVQTLLNKNLVTPPLTNHRLNLPHTQIIMPRGEGTQSKVHFKGKEDDFIVFVDSVEDVKKWKRDKSIPLAQVVNSFKIFVTHKHGAQGQMDTASKATLENEFGTSVEEDCLKKILEEGNTQQSETGERYGSKNDSIGSRSAH